MTPTGTRTASGVCVVGADRSGGEFVKVRVPGAAPLSRTRRARVSGPIPSATKLGAGACAGLSGDRAHEAAGRW